MFVYCREHSNAVECVAFSPATSNKILDQIAGNETVKSLPENNNSNGPSNRNTMNGVVNSTQSSTTDRNKLSGLYVASGSRDKTIKIFESYTGRCILTLV
jgi:WD40 repeat protein